MINKYIVWKQIVFLINRENGINLMYLYIEFTLLPVN